MDLTKCTKLEGDGEKIDDLGEGQFGEVVLEKYINTYTAKK